MKGLLAYTGLVLVLGAGAAGAQIYKWVDAKGVTHYSDVAPPPSAGKVQLKSFASAAAAPELPRELAEAVKNYPVTLYTSAQCEACDLGRAMLQERGVPYAEKTVSSAADHAALKLAGSVGQLPLLVVGSRKNIGFEAGAWATSLSAAAYPAQPSTPPGYRFAPAVPAAGAAAPPQIDAATAAREAAQAAAARSIKLPAVNAPPDFRF